jgi:hypothetical protein
LINAINKPGIAGLVSLKHSHILGKEVFKLFISQHFVNQLENGLFARVGVPL